MKLILVLSILSNVATEYDLMNYVSAGIHFLWNNHFINTLDSMQNTQLSDVAGRAGEIAFPFVDKNKSKYSLDLRSKVVVFVISIK